MGYPNYPSNRLILNVKSEGSSETTPLDLTERYGMILLDGYTINPPEPKTYFVDIPCADGKLDLTEALIGRATYNNRSMEFNFCIINVTDVEAMKSELNALLHGRAFDFRITMDPNYIYHGRFTVSEYGYSVYDVGKVLTVKLTIDANPYKTLPDGTKVI